MRETFLMCPPQYFDVKYVINPWMEGNINKTDHAAAKQQWQDFYDHLKQYADVKLLEPHPDLPDLVFTANPGLAKDKLLVLSHFRHLQRQPEEAIFKQWFSNRGYEIAEIPKNIFFEGGGDALFQPDQSLLWMGYGFRSDLKACEFLETYFSMPVVPLKLINDKFYHLDICLCPLLNGYVMYFPGAFERQSINLIEANVAENKRIVISEEDAYQLACNAVLVRTNKSNIIFINAATPALKNQLEQLGYEVIIQPVKEFNKSGGANRCLILNIS